MFGKRYITEEEMNRQIERYERINVMKERKMAVDEVKNRYKVPLFTMENFSNKMVFISAFNIIWFTIACMILQFMGFAEMSSQLIVSWYAFWTVEIIALMSIKVSKVKANASDDDMVDIDLDDYDFTLTEVTEDDDTEE